MANMRLNRGVRPWSRRAFLRGSAFGAAGILWSCGDRSVGDMVGAEDAPDAGGSPPGPVAGDQDGSQGGGAPQQPGSCGALTEANAEGPFYKVNAPERASLAETGVQGTRLRISGRVLGAGCAPLAGAVLDFWQADGAGAYDNQGFLLRGVQRAGADGSYQLDTIVPGRYLNGSQYRPAHIHVKVAAPGLPLLTTQLYFAGDPYNEIDGLFRPSLVMQLSDGPEGLKLASFDFVVAR
jgi:hypothetical protein